MSAKPTRLRLSRAKGFNLQALSFATNGLPAVNVARPTKWGNPFVIGKDVGTNAQAVAAFKELLEPNPPHIVALYMTHEDIVRDLRGKNLACACALDRPCHADVLLEIANIDQVKP